MFLHKIFKLTLQNKRKQKNNTYNEIVSISDKQP